MVITPMIFFGCTYYPWSALKTFPILQKLVLINPLVYASDGLCTHEHVHLSDGLVMGHVIECPKHNGRFDVRDGKPFGGAMVVLVPQDLQNNLPLVRRDQSDLDGTFTLGSVVPGKYTVIAIEHGWELDWMSSQVLDGYLKGGESVTVAAEKKLEVKVGVE